MKCGFNVISKHIKSEITQHPNQCSPAHGCPPAPSEPLLENLRVDRLSIVHAFEGNSINSCSISVIEEEDAKCGIMNANFLGNVDLSLPPLEIE